MMKFACNVNGWDIQAAYSKQNIDTIFIPLLRQWTEMQANKAGRLIVFLAAPPAVGKTTLSLFLEHLSATLPGCTEAQAIGLDGFHFPERYLERQFDVVNGQFTSLRAVKGCPETFDRAKLTSKLAAMQKNNIWWPVYDRTLHDVLNDQLYIDKDIVIFEGNWLLLAEDGWNQLKQFCDYSMFISADQHLLKNRLIERKIRGGLTKKAAERFYKASDAPNIKRALQSRLPAELELVMQPDSTYEIAQVK